MRIALCDTNIDETRRTKKIIYEYANRNNIDAVVYEYRSGLQLITSGIKFQLVILDYNIGTVNGLEAARILRERDKSCAIMFLSSRTDFILDAFKVNPYRFLLKPATKEKLFAVFDEFLKTAHAHRPLWVKDGDDTFCFNTKEIFYLEADNKNCNISLRNKKIRCRKTMAQVYKALPKNQFCKINRAYIVNFDYITAYSADSIKLNNGERLHMSRGYCKSFKNEYRAFSDPKEL